MQLPQPLQRSSFIDTICRVNVEELVTHGKAKHVGIILWVIWKTLDDQLEEALDQFVEWGVKGIAVRLRKKMNFYR